MSKHLNRTQEGMRPTGASGGPDANNPGHHISAPYNFVPLANWVHIPEWGKRVSHDLPFKDGYCGEIAYTLIAESPLLVGGHQKKSDGDLPGEVRPFKLPDGTFAIPGSSLKGMLRAVVEIAGFGRMRMVDDGRPGLRDISGRYVSQSYAEKVRNKVKTGFLRQSSDGGQEIIPCRMVRLDHRVLETALGVEKPIFRKGVSVADKYRRWMELCREKGRDPQVLSFELEGSDANQLYRGQFSGTPVFTGQISDSTERGGKRRDFVFYDEDTSEVIDVPDDTWRDFLRIHGDADGANSMSWPGRWKRIHRDGGKVPVFYVQDDDLLRIGLAFMPKLAGYFSIHKMIGHSAEAHIQSSDREHRDLADLLFGSVNGKDQNDALRGRVSCEPAISAAHSQELAHPPTILNGPKPSFFPNYIAQQADPPTWTLGFGQYATYMETQQVKLPTLRGFKRYPARGDQLIHTQPIVNEQQQNRKIQVRLFSLPKGAKFTGRVVFHNLRREELGALLWAMTWGDESTYLHGMGMGKPFGFGQVRFVLHYAESGLVPNDPDASPVILDHATVKRFLQEFVDSMEVACQKHSTSWKHSIQIDNLLAMADPQSANSLPKGMELRHMRLGKGSNNEFVEAKQAGAVLPDYATASGRRLPAQWWTAESGRERGPKGTDGRSAKSPAAASETVWNQARLKFNQRNGTLIAVGPAGAEANALAPRGEELLKTLPHAVRIKVESNQFVRIVARVRGKELVSVAATTEK